jgi:hypothetical protein
MKKLRSIFLRKSQLHRSRYYQRHVQALSHALIRILQCALDQKIGRIRIAIIASNRTRPASGVFKIYKIKPIFGRSTKMFAEVRQYSELFGAGGLGMGTSPVATCETKYKRTEGGITVCADGNATDSWDDPWANGRSGWGFYNNGFADPVPCPSDAFCQKVLLFGLSVVCDFGLYFHGNAAVHRRQRNFLNTSLKSSEVIACPHGDARKSTSITVVSLDRLCEIESLRIWCRLISGGQTHVGGCLQLDFSRAEGQLLDESTGLPHLFVARIV